MDTLDPTSLFDHLAGLDISRLRELYLEISKEIDEMVAEEKALAGRREILERRREVVDSVGRFLAAERPPEPKPPANTPQPTVPEAVVRILDGNPERIWDSAAILVELRAMSLDSTPENARVALRRLAKAKKVRRVGRGTYQSLLADPDPGLHGEESEDEG